MRNAGQVDEWIKSARARLAAQGHSRPSTKAGAVRALWSEIEQAVESGHSLKTIRDWLEVEGVPLQYNQFTTYVMRIRRTQDTEAHGDRTIDLLAEPQAVSGRVVPTQPSDPLANLRSRQGQPRAFEYNPDFKEEDLL